MAALTEVEASCWVYTTNEEWVIDDPKSRHYVALASEVKLHANFTLRDREHALWLDSNSHRAATLRPCVRLISATPKLACDWRPASPAWPIVYHLSQLELFFRLGRGVC